MSEVKLGENTVGGSRAEVEVVEDLVEVVDLAGHGFGVNVELGHELFVGHAYPFPLQLISLV